MVLLKVRLPRPSKVIGKVAAVPIPANAFGMMRLAPSEPMEVPPLFEPEPKRTLLVPKGLLMIVRALGAPV